MQLWAISAYCFLLTVNPWFIINKQTCKDRVLMAFVWKLVSICLHHNILFKAKHIQGVRNRSADALSRLQVQTFRHLAPPHMDSLPSEIPRCLRPQNWGLLSPCVLSPVSSLHLFWPISGLGEYFYQFRHAIFHSVCKAFPIVPHKHWLFLLLICTTKSMLRLL